MKSIPEAPALISQERAEWAPERLEDFWTTEIRKCYGDDSDLERACTKLALLRTDDTTE